MPKQDRIEETKDSIYQELEHVFGKFRKHCMNIFKEISMSKWVGKIFSNPQLRLKVPWKVVLIKELEWNILPHRKT
jgi:hypothetical protein